jgi:hypothetical protein
MMSEELFPGGPVLVCPGCGSPGVEVEHPFCAECAAVVPMASDG